MLPYILAAVGGYLIGQSQKKDAPQMAKGGMTDLEKYHNENGPYITEMELDEYFEKSVDGYKKEDFFNVAENMGYEYDEDSDQYIKMAKGGKTKDYMLYEYIVTTKIVDEQGSNKEIDSWVYANDEKSAIEKAEKNIKKDNPKVEIKESSVSEVEDDGEYAKGGKVKSKKWIQDALSGGNNKGALRRTAKRKGLLRGDENLSMTDLKKLEKMGGTTAKRAYMAETLRKFD